MSPDEMARCYTPTFLYQCHCDGYVEMSKEDAALFWEIDSHPAAGPGDGGVEPKLEEKTIPETEETVPENSAVTGPVPDDKPDDPRSTGMLDRPVRSSQDIKPADLARRAHVQERLDAPADDSVSPGPPCPLVTASTQTDVTSQPEIETWRENETPVPLKETVTPGPKQPASIKTPTEGQRRADTETPDKPELESVSLWTLLPFAEATWRTTYRARAVTSADDVDPRVQEVLDLPVLNLAAVQSEDPDLVFVKELLREYDVRPPWNVVREESAEVKILWT